jgi:hypothetical protein
MFELKAIVQTIISLDATDSLFWQIILHHALHWLSHDFSPMFNAKLLYIPIVWKREQHNPLRLSAYEFISFYIKAPGKFSGFAYADARGSTNLFFGELRSIINRKVTSDGQTILRCTDTKSFAELSGTTAEISYVKCFASLLHYLNAFDWFDGTDEHCAHAILIRRDIRTKMHAIRKVHVPMSVGVADYLTARCDAMGVRCLIGCVCLCFDNDSGAIIELYDLSEQLLRHLYSISFKPQLR